MCKACDAQGYFSWIDTDITGELSQAELEFFGPVLLGQAASKPNHGEAPQGATSNGAEHAAPLPEAGTFVYWWDRLMWLLEGFFASSVTLVVLLTSTAVSLYTARVGPILFFLAPLMYSAWR